MNNLKTMAGRSAIISTLVVIGTASLYIMSKGLTNRPQNTLQAQTEVEQSQYSRALPEGFAQPTLNGGIVPLPATNSDPVINGVKNPIRGNAAVPPVPSVNGNLPQPSPSGDDFSRPALPAATPTPSSPPSFSSAIPEPAKSNADSSSSPTNDSTTNLVPANTSSQPSSGSNSLMMPSSAALMPAGRETNAPAPSAHPAVEPANPLPSKPPAATSASTPSTTSSLAPSAVIPTPTVRPFSTTALESNNNNSGGEGRYFNPRGEAIASPPTVAAPAIGAPPANPALAIAAPNTIPPSNAASALNRAVPPRANVPAPTFGALSPTATIPANPSGPARTTIPAEPTRIKIARNNIARPSATTANNSAALGNSGASGLQPLETAERKPIAKVTAGDGTLPNSQRQIWREYEITPFVEKWSTTPQVEQTIVDWILRETGYEAWHGDVVSILSADAKKLKVYHTPEMQGVVSEIIDRFVNPATADEIFGMHVISLDSPMWRVKAQSILKPIPAQTPGVQAWTARKEDAAILVSEFRKRTDYREHGNPQMIAANGQALKSQILRARPFTQAIQAVQQTSTSLAALQPIGARVEEGSRLEFTPLVGIDGRTAEIMVKCDIEQLEKLHETQLSFPTPTGDKNQVKIETPQMSGAHLHEKFRWQKDQVLIIGLGVVPTPTPTDSGASFLPILNAAPARADVLLFIEHRGKSSNEKREPKP